METQTLEVISINIWQIVVSLCNLIILFFVLKKFLYKPVKKVLAERSAAVEKEYSDARNASGVYGAFPKLLTDYVRDRNVFSIEEAVYKMTAKPAAVLGLNRGILQKGMPADINVFHLDKLQIHADFQNPDQYCTGFDYVLVGGEIAVEKDQYRNSKSGVLQRRSGN